LGREERITLKKYEIIYKGFIAPCQRELRTTLLSLRVLIVLTKFRVYPRYIVNTIKAVRDEIKSSVTAAIPASASLNAVATVAQKKTTKEAIITAFSAYSSLLPY
jgi:hypothetical protein